MIKYTKWVKKEPHKTINPKRVYEVRQIDFCSFGMPEQSESSPNKYTPAGNSNNKKSIGSKSELPVELTKYDLELAKETCDLLFEVIQEVRKTEDLKSGLKRRGLSGVGRKCQ